MQRLDHKRRKIFPTLVTKHSSQNRNDTLDWVESCNLWTLEIPLRKQSWDGKIAQWTYHQAKQPEFERREWTPKSCPLTFTNAGAHTDTHTDAINQLIKIKQSKGQSGKNIQNLSLKKDLSTQNM